MQQCPSRQSTLSSTLCPCGASLDVGTGRVSSKSGNHRHSGGGGVVRCHRSCCMPVVRPRNGWREARSESTRVRSDDPVSSLGHVCWTGPCVGARSGRPRKRWDHRWVCASAFGVDRRRALSSGHNHICCHLVRGRRSRRYTTGGEAVTGRGAVGDDGHTCPFASCVFRSASLSSRTVRGQVGAASAIASGTARQKGHVVPPGSANLRNLYLPAARTHRRSCARKIETYLLVDL